MTSPLRRATVLSLVCLAGSCSAAVASELGPFGHACTLEPYGVRFCPTPEPTATSDERVRSWDGAPLDVDVTLPATGNGPFPIIAMLHGYDGDKTSYETTDPSGGDHYTNVWFAKQGYAVLNLSVRGVGGSCGTPEARTVDPGVCNNVAFELGDQRYDARDVQWLLGLLVDEGIANPKELGVTGISLGSLETLELALLKNRIRLLNGSYAPWRSPKGVPLHISAAYPAWAITSLGELAAPNARFLDYEPSTAAQYRQMIGVIKGSFPTLVGLINPIADYSSPPGTGNFPFQTDLLEGETSQPDSPFMTALANQLVDYHQSLGMTVAATPAPILMEDGWQDDIVGGPAQALMLRDYLSLVAPKAYVAVQLADVGHGLSLNRPADVMTLNDQATGFFDHFLKGTGTAPAAGSITAYTTPCPAGTPSQGPYVASSWSALHPGAFVFGAAPTVDVDSGGDPSIGPQIDPVAGQDGHCPTFTATDYPGTAVYTRRVTKSFTVLGIPTLRMDVDMAGDNGQLDARLWDVAPDGKEQLVSTGGYELTTNQHGQITWQLFGAGYRFLAGHTVRLELLNSEAPLFRPSLDDFTLSVSHVTIQLPTHEPPDGGELVPPIFGAESSPSACPAPSGSLAAGRIGPLSLGMTRTEARRLLSRFSTRGRRNMDFFCLSSSGIRVGYLRKRAVLLLTANRYYALRGVRPGARLAAVAERLHIGMGYRVGLNTWYLTPGTVSRGVLKVRQGVIEEVGIADKASTPTRRESRRFLSSFP